MVELAPPLIITARLLPGVRIGDVFISLEAQSTRTAEGRVRYLYYLDGPGWSHNAADLCSGVGNAVDYRGTMGTLLAFLGACAEAGEDGDNSDLFPANVREWAEECADDISMLQLEIEEG